MRHNYIVYSEGARIFLKIDLLLDFSTEFVKNEENLPPESFNANTWVDE